MNIIILGGGIIGVFSAYFLQQSGHKVTVIERQNEVASETSFANGGQVSVGYSEPWASMSNLKKTFSWLGKKDSPILIEPLEILKNPAWFIEFVKQCVPSMNEKNILSMLKLSEFSRSTLIDLRNELNLNYDHKSNGILTYYTNTSSMKKSYLDTALFNKYGCNRRMKSIEEIYQLEPSLVNNNINILGGDYLLEDESGDANLLTLELKKHCEQIGVNFILGHEIIRINHKHNLITNIVIKKIKYNSHLTNNSYDLLNINEKEITLEAESFVCCLGSYSQKMLHALPLSDKLYLYPVKGYSATINIHEPSLINNISLTDSDRKIVFTRLGNRLRVAGTAEFNGFNLDINSIRCSALTQRAFQLFPKGLDEKNIFYWSGLRPTTPHGMPYIKRSSINNLFLNFGHGTLGLTMSAGSGKLISRIINNEQIYR